MKELRTFFAELEENNTRDWFHSQKPRFEHLKSVFLTEVQDIINTLQLTDPQLSDLDAKNTIFRIYRDVRFSNDKRPYKTHIGAYMAKGGRKSSSAGYYLHLSATECFLGAGAHSPNKDDLHAIRTEILYQPDKYKSIIDKHMANGFKVIESDKLKTAPRGFPKDSPHIDLIRYKHYFLVKDLKNNELNQGTLAKQAVSHYSGLLDYVNFLNESMSFSGNE